MGARQTAMLANRGQRRLGTSVGWGANPNGNGTHRTSLEYDEKSQIVTPAKAGA